MSNGQITQRQQDGLQSHARTIFNEYYGNTVGPVEPVLFCLPIPFSDSFPRLDGIWNGHLKRFDIENKLTFTEKCKMLNTCHISSNGYNF